MTNSFWKLSHHTPHSLWCPYCRIRHWFWYWFRCWAHSTPRKNPSTLFWPNTLSNQHSPTPLDQLFSQFEGEVVSILNTLTKVFTSNSNLSEVCVPTNNFKCWIEVISEELEFMCLKEAKRNFHARLFGIVEPLLQKVPPAFLLPTTKFIPPHSLVPTTLVSYEWTLEDKSIFGVKKNIIFDQVIMKTLEHPATENYKVKERLSNRMRRHKRLKGCLEWSYQDCHPSLHPSF